MTIVLYCWLHSYTYHCCHLHQDHCALSFIQWTILCCPRILLQLEIWSSYSPVRDSHTLRHTVSNNTLSLTHAHTCGCAGCWAACAECLLPVATGNGQAVQYYCCRMDVSSPFLLFRWFVPLHGLCCTTTKNTCFVKYLETKQSLPFQKTWKVLIAKCKHVDQAHDTAHICHVICTAYILAVQNQWACHSILLLQIIVQKLELRVPQKTKKYIYPGPSSTLWPTASVHLTVLTFVKY